MTVAHPLGSVISMCIFKIQGRIIYGSNPILCTEMSTDMNKA